LVIVGRSGGPTPFAVPFATGAQTTTGTADDLAVTPEGLATLTATATRRGLVELATSAETSAGTDNIRAVTPDGLNDHPGEPRAIATGSYSSTTDLSSGSGVGISRTFPSGRFSTAPVVMVIPTKSARIQCAALNITSTGFTAQLDNFSGANASDRDFNWIAIEEW